jgi:hypothetical protein
MPNSLPNHDDRSMRLTRRTRILLAGAMMAATVLVGSTAARADVTPPESEFAEIRNV